MNLLSFYVFTISPSSFIIWSSNCKSIATVFKWFISNQWVLIWTWVQSRSTSSTSLTKMQSQMEKIYTVQNHRCYICLLVSLLREYVSSKTINKVVQVHDRIFCCMSGSLADAQAVTKAAKFQLSFHRYTADTSAAQCSSGPCESLIVIKTSRKLVMSDVSVTFQAPSVLIRAQQVKLSNISNETEQSFEMLFFCYFFFINYLLFNY